MLVKNSKLRYAFEFPVLKNFPNVALKLMYYNYNFLTLHFHAR